MNRPAALAALVLVVTAVTAAGCAHDKLDPSYGLTYQAVFAAQRSNHPGRDVGPLRGEESKRIARRYYTSLGGEDKEGQSAPSGGPGDGPQLPGMGGAGATQQPNPFALKGR